LSEFLIFCHAGCLEIEISLKTFHRVMKQVAMFVGKVTFKLEFEFKIFVLFTYNMWCSMLKFETFLHLFDIFI
jgi:hypothetical protein